jgi:hypothetical protein
MYKGGRKKAGQKGKKSIHRFTEKNLLVTSSILKAFYSYSLFKQYKNKLFFS